MTTLHKITQKSSNFYAKYSQNYSKHTNFTQNYDKNTTILLQNGLKLYKNSLKSVYFRVKYNKIWQNLSQIDNFMTIFVLYRCRKLYARFRAVLFVAYSHVIFLEQSCQILELRNRIFVKSTAVSQSKIAYSRFRAAKNAKAQSRTCIFVYLFS